MIWQSQLLELKLLAAMMTNAFPDFFTITNKNGMKALIAKDNGRLTSLIVPDKKENFIDIVLDESFGFQKSVTKSIINDINNEKKNISLNTRQPNGQSIELNYFSNKGINEPTGRIDIKLVYRLNDDNCLKISCEAISDELLLLNIPGYAFFNLNGKDEKGVLKHQLFIKADHYLPVNSAVIQTGDIESVIGTPFDFRRSAFICSRIYDHHLQLKNASGYNHCFVLCKCSANTPVAKIRGDKSDITMEFFTDQPKLLFRSNYFYKNREAEKLVPVKRELSNSFNMFSGSFYDNHSLSDLPSIALHPNQVYKSVCRYLIKN